jgi:hypothetical protein
MKDLGALNTHSTIKDSAAHGMNDFGHVVGTSGSDVLPVYAVYWPGSGSLQDLNGLVPVNSGWLLEDAKGIDNVGQIVGQGQVGSNTHAFLLTPTTTTTAAVPAPTSPATVSSFSIPLSSPAAAPAPFWVVATATNAGPTGRHNQTAPFSLAASDRGRPSTLSKGGTIAPDGLALEVRDRVFAAFADDVVTGLL